MRAIRIFAVCCLVLAGLAAPVLSFAQVCDPPGPPPRFGCSWSTEACDWFCPICDPYGPPPRTGCSWDNWCTWTCPGYTGVRVTVETLAPPSSRATVYVRLESLCAETGVLATCSGSFGVRPSTTVEETCAAIESVVAQHCGGAGYEVTLDACATSARFEAANAACPKTPFAIGVSDDPAVFDQTGAGPLPDGEADQITGSTATCAFIPGPVTNLQVSSPGLQTLVLIWDPVPDADDYIIYSDTTPGGPFDSVAGTGTSGATIPMPAPSEFYRVAARNQSCGLGPRD
jgi:hypothetical protein